jgi:hypothetical protein
VALASVTVQVPLPVQPPDQPANVELAFGAALNVTTVPLLKAALHACPQLIPAGLLVIVPAPVPVPWTVSWKVLGGGFVEPLFVDPQPQRRKERNTRQEKLKTVLSVDIVPQRPRTGPVAQAIISPAANRERLSYYGSNVN